MKLGRDFATAIGTSIWSMAVALATVPLFIHYLGVEAYGLIGFSTAVQSILVLLDLGLSQTVSREIARASVSDRLAGARDLLRSLAWIYWVVAALIGGALVLLAPVLAVNWLNLGRLSPEVASSALLLMGIQIALRWPSGLYIGALMGARRLVLASIIGAIYFTIAYVGALGVLAWWSPTIKSFFVWQALAGLGYTLALQHAAWRSIGGARGARFNLLELRQIWRFSAGMTGVALASIFITQLDKVILSKIISLEAFGRYMLAVLVTSSLYRLTTPLLNTIYPRFSVLIAEENEDKLRLVYRVVSNVFAMFWIPTIMMIAVCARPLLFLWTGVADIADRAAPLLALLVLGTGLHGLTLFPYSLQLAYGRARLALQMHGVLIAVQLPILLVLAIGLGAFGAALAWLILYIVYVLVALVMTHRVMLVGVGRQWLLSDLGRPFAATVPFGAAGVAIMPLLSYSPLLQVAAGAGLALLALLTSLVLCPHTLADVRLALAD